MGIVERIAEFHDDLTNWRRDIHAHPELGFEEHRTSDFVAQKLAEFGYDTSEIEALKAQGVIATQRRR